MKVFVLICESIYDMGDQNLSCAVFDSFEKAKNQMTKEYEKALVEYDAVDSRFEEMPEDGFLGTISWSGADVYLAGRYSETHVVWEIQEKEIC